MIEDKFELKDEEYWAEPWRTRRTLQRPLMQSNQEGLLLGTPAGVALDQHKSFPAAIVRVAKLTTIKKIASHSMMIITALELGTNELRAQLAVPDARPQPPAGPAKPGAAAASKDSFSGDDTAMVSEGHTLDLATLLKLPSARSEYLVTVIMLDQISNRSRMKVVDSAGYDDPAVDDFLVEYRAGLQKPAAVFPTAADPLPNYKQQDNSPAMPAEPGIALTVSRVNVLSPKNQCLMVGSYRLPIHPQHVVKPAENGKDAGKEAAKPPSDPDAKALVPITLLITGSSDAAPQIVKLTIPSYGPLENADGRIVATGYFAFDLIPVAKTLTTPQTYFIYAFSGEVMTGAIPTAFIRLPEDETEGAQSW